MIPTYLTKCRDIFLQCTINNPMALGEQLELAPMPSYNAEDIDESN
jgi:hypothetical protein